MIPIKNKKPAGQRRLYFCAASSPPNCGLTSAKALIWSILQTNYQRLRTGKHPLNQALNRTVSEQKAAERRLMSFSNVGICIKKFDSGVWAERARRNNARFSKSFTPSCHAVVLSRPVPVVLS